MSSFKDLGNEAFKQKDYPTAIKHYTAAIEENSNDHTLYGNRAASYHNMGSYANAEGDADKCIELKSDWSKGFQRKAMAQQARGDLENAVTNYEKAVELDASNS